MAMTRSALAWRQTGLGWVNAVSCRAHSIACFMSQLAPNIPSGLIRINAPFAWLTVPLHLRSQLPRRHPPCRFRHMVDLMTRPRTICAHLKDKLAHLS